MDYKKLGGYGLFLFAALFALDTVADKWADVQAWEGALSFFTPAFIAVLIKGFMPALLGAAGGLLLPTIGPSGGWDGIDTRGTLPEKIAKVVEADPAAATVKTAGSTITVETKP